MIRPPWDFEYRPIHAEPTDDSAYLDDFIIASQGPVDPARVTDCLGQLAPELRVAPVLDWHPLYWTRVRCAGGIERAACEQRLRADGVAVRYVASALVGSQRLPPALDFDGCLPMRASRWPVRGPSLLDEKGSPGRWFVEATGVEVDRRACGTGAGTRLAVIDDDAGTVERLDLDDSILVGVDQVPAGSSHAAQLVAWAVGAKSGGAGCGFVGVAPDASPRIYFIPKPGSSVFHFPLAIVRALADGADVVVCATNVDGQYSPMLDDALELARRLGRCGRGAPVVMPCGRETSSPEGSVHSSLSLGVGEPASDPRVFCVAPSGHDGGWFLWRDRRGRLHPFANRGPALRWLAPGDDVALPFRSPEIMSHAESSGASAMAAGVLLLVLGTNPQLSLSELEDVLTSTVGEVEAEPSCERRGLADPYDLLPVGRDRDGHNAKHGYGRLQATRACLLASDPIAFALVSIGEDQAALRWLELRNEEQTIALLYCNQLATWATRVLLADATERHAICCFVRLLRLLAARPERLRDQVPGAILRHVSSLLRDLPRSQNAPVIDAPLRQEMADLTGRAHAFALDAGLVRGVERQICVIAAALWPAGDSQAVALRQDLLTPPVALVGA
jgi:hypothetical protein